MFFIRYGKIVCLFISLIDIYESLLYIRNWLGFGNVMRIKMSKIWLYFLMSIWISMDSKYVNRWV